MKSKIIDEIHDRAKKAGLNLNKSDHEGAFNIVFDSLKAVIEREGSARVPGLGTFTKKYREGRNVRNPRTGESVQTSAKHVITFKQSKSA